MELGRRRGFPLRGFDGGYLIHCQLGELFGEAAPGPFMVTDDRGRYLTVLAYSDMDAEGLKEWADTFADPAVHATLDWEGFASKPMPTTWATGRRLGFELRACPTVRMSSAGPRHRKGAEVDAFLAACFREPEAKIDREGVYRSWLVGQFERIEGARPVGLEVEAYKRERLLRPTHREKPRTRVVERPEVTFRGELEVTEGGSFAALLRRGIGRHRAFGFGMVLLRPPRSG
jgi:CRISPR system Cascade subunit CasE